MSGDASSPGPHWRNTGAILQVILLVFAVALCLIVLYRIQIVILVVVFAILFAYLIAPPVLMVERFLRRPSLSRATSRGLAVGLVYLTMTGAAGAAVVLLVPRLSSQASQIAAEGPTYAAGVRAWSTEWIAWERDRLPPEWQARVDEAIAANIETMAVYVRESALATIAVLTLLPWLVLIPVLAFFFLKDQDALRYYAVQALPPQWRGPGYRLAQELNSAIASYIRAQLLACLIIGVTCGLGFALLGVPYAALLGAMAGVLEFVPLVGPLLTAVAATLVAAFQTPGLAAWVLVFLVVLRVLQDYVIYPRLIGHGTHLPPLMIILGVLIGAELGGIIGIFLAVPVLATLSVGYRHWTDWRHLADVVPHPPAGQGAAPANGDDQTRMTMPSYRR